MKKNRYLKPKITSKKVKPSYFLIRNKNYYFNPTNLLAGTTRY